MATVACCYVIYGILTEFSHLKMRVKDVVKAIAELNRARQYRKSRQKSVDKKVTEWRVEKKQRPAAKAMDRRY